MSTIDVVLALYNGEAHLDQQVESLLNQTYTDWQLLIRDDGSRDQSLAIARRYVAEYPGRIQIIQDNLRAGGASANFGVLLGSTTAPYVVCCDQDDVWRPRKLERLMECTKAYEAQVGPGKPLLVHSDLVVVDEHLMTLAPSFWKFQNLNPAWATSFPRALTQNVVTGCTVLVNRTLLDLALPVPSRAIMHDWWLALVAAAFGDVIVVEEPLVYYRQHGRNDVGAKRFDAQYILRRVEALRDGEATGLEELAHQAAAFAEQFGGTPAALKAAAFAALPNLPHARRRLQIVQQGFWKIGAVRNAGWLLWA